jgi:hypothetical protein
MTSPMAKTLRGCLKSARWLDVRRCWTIWKARRALSPSPSGRGQGEGNEHTLTPSPLPRWGEGKLAFPSACLRDLEVLCRHALTALFLLFVTACGAARNGDYVGEPVSSVEGGPTTPFALAIWQGRDVRRWAPVSAKPDGTIWERLRSSLDKILPAQALEGRGATAAMGSLDGLPSFVFVLVTADTRLAPVGPAGSSVALAAGTHTLRRWCTADQPNNFEEIAPTDPMVDSMAVTDEKYYGIDPYVPACNLVYAPKRELGVKVGALPAENGGPVPVTDLAWAPTSQAVYLLAGTLVRHDVKLLRYSLGASSLEQVATGHYYLPLEVDGAGRVLVNEVSWSGDVDTGDITTSLRRVSLSWRGSGQVSTADLPVSALPPAGTRPLDVISPDGTILAYGRSDGRIDLIDLSSGAVLPASPGMGLPLAWDPSGQKLLVQWNGETVWRGLDGSQGSVTSTSASGRFQPALGRQDLTFWGVSGPKQLRQDGDGTQLIDLQTGSSVRLIDSDRVAPPGAMLGLAPPTEQVFAWAVQCLGLAETACTSELRRLTIPTGIIDVVARADNPLPFAVSPDGRQLALVHADGLYIKTIEP